MVVMPNINEPVVILMSETESETDSNSQSIVTADAYTFTDSEGYYTPWGTDVIDTGMDYFKIALGAVGIVAAFCFAIPYAVELINSLFRSFRDSFR